MAEKRKLQGEIERGLKKVNEGRTSFKEILEKFEQANQASQKEKYEMELKREIKKLQRLRDQIKNWLQSGEVKEKGALAEARRHIENDMERFKVIEKETKTKAYSKEGLYNPETRKDPQRKEKEEMTEWLRTMIATIEKNHEQCEAEVFNLEGRRGGGRKRGDLAEKERMIHQIRGRQEMYRFHSAKLETVMRLFDNDKIEMSKMRDFSHHFEEFINTDHPQMYEEDHGAFMYDELMLDELSGELRIDADPEESLDEPQLKKTPIPLRVTPATSTHKTDHHQPSAPETPVSTSRPQSTVKEPPPSVKILFNEPAQTEPICVPVTASPPTPASTSSTAPLASVTRETHEAVSRPIVNSSSTAVTSSVTPVTNTTDTPHSQRVVSSPPAQSAVSVTTAAAISTVSSLQLTTTASHSMVSPSQTVSASLHSTPSQSDAPLPHHSQQQQPQQQPQQQQQQESSFDLFLDPGDAMSPFRNPDFSKEVPHENISCLEKALVKHAQHLHPTDMEKARMLIPRVEAQTPSHFPRESPITHIDEQEYYYRLDSDTLFFIFYYFEGSRAQFLAARALKRMSWRFHTGHLCWFQRHEEPKNITENSESGTYIFYDYETMTRKKKENFTFTYKYLEDNDF